MGERMLPVSNQSNFPLRLEMTPGTYRADARKYGPSILGSRISVFLLALIAFVAIDVGVFRSGFYHGFIEPNSSLGIFQFRTNLGMSKIASGENLVAFIGDSRIQDGFSEQTFDSISGPKGSRAINLGLPTSAPRIWYYLLKKVDPNCNAFRAIVIGLPTYRDVDEQEDFVDRPYDSHYLMPYLSATDAVELTTSYDDRSMQGNAAMQWLVKSFALRADLADFCFHPLSRLADVEHSQKYGAIDWYHYQGRTTCLDGIQMRNGSWVRGTSNVTDVAVQRLNDRVFTPLPEQTGKRQRYNTYWLNKLLDRYSASNTKFVFVKLPNDPIPRAIKIPANYATLNSLKNRRNVLIMPENYFADLDSPKFFGDEIHLNTKGRIIFSTELSRYIITALGAENALAVDNSSQTHL
jgi:hypothetical protein